jgi:hypothetical protein
LEFYITAGCTLHVIEKKEVITTLRMDSSLDSFTNGGGSKTFTDNIATSLGIDTTLVYVKSVYEGSLVVNYAITAPGGDADKLNEIKNTQT